MAISIVGVQAHGVDTNNADSIVRTDTAGRVKISHGQPPGSTGTITANGQTVFAPVDGMSDVLWYFWGTAHAGVNLAFEQSPDSTNGVDGTWFAVISANQATVGNFASSTGVIASNTGVSHAVSAPGAAFVRVRATAYTSGTLNVMAVPTTAARPLSVAANINGNIGGTVTANPNQSEQLESTANLAANATYTGATRDNGGTSTASRRTILRPMIMHNAGNNHGTLILQESTDGTTWRETRRTPIPSDASYRSFEWPLHLRYYRLLFTNGATAQTGFFLQTLNVQGESGSMDAKNNLSFLLSTAALAAAATFTSPTLDLGDNHIWNTVRARVNLGTASTTVTVRIESSHDGTVWAASPAATQTSTAAGIVAIERPIVERYIRLVVVNGATAQASNQFSLALISL